MARRDKAGTVLWAGAPAVWMSVEEGVTGRVTGRGPGCLAGREPCRRQDRGGPSLSGLTMPAHRLDHTVSYLEREDAY